MITENLHRHLEFGGQVFFVHCQFVQPHEDVRGFVVAGHLGKFQGTEQQVVSVGGDALLFQLVGVFQLQEMRLDIVLGRRQKRQRIAQYRIVRFELLH